MKPKRKRKSKFHIPPPMRGCLITMCITFGVIACGCVGMWHWIGGLSYPPSDMLARQYLDAVLRQDLEAVKASAGSCKSLIDQAQSDMILLTNAEVQQVNIVVSPNNGSSDTLEFVMLTFEFRKRGETDWQAATLTFTTDYAPPGLRQLCYFF